MQGDPAQLRELVNAGLAADLRLKTDPVRVRETEFFIIRKD